MPVAVFLGAGFSAAAGLPWGTGLFETELLAHTHKAAADMRAVLDAYQAWRADHPQARSEEFVTAIYKDSIEVALGGLGWLWPKLVRFLAYQLASPQASVQVYGERINRTRDNVAVARLHPVHKAWWNHVLAPVRNGVGLSVITTNWDILIERALRPSPTQRPWRPGFNYGNGPEEVAASSGYPGSRWLADLGLRGTVPLLKLHGSLNWAVKSGQLIKYGDLRPAFRGDAAIVPPTQEKAPPSWAADLWSQARKALGEADHILVVGYSFPPYDTHIWNLFRDGLTASHASMHVFDPDSREICAHLKREVRGVEITAHAGLPDALVILPELTS